mgnify:CR=1 FL=1
MKTYTTGQAGRIIGKSADTLRRWDKIGKLKPKRDETGRRAYTMDQLSPYISKTTRVKTDELIESVQDFIAQLMENKKECLKK